MKITAIIVALLAAASAAAQDPKPAPQDHASATISVVTIQCGMCVSSITKALKATEGVASAQVDLDEKTATVTFDPKKTDLKKLEKAIALVGYDANDTTRDPKAYEKLSPCCKTDE